MNPLPKEALNQLKKLERARDLPQLSFDTCAPLIDGINATTFWCATPKRTWRETWHF